MPLPTTLLDFATGEKSRYETLENEAAQALSAARDDLEAARADLRERSEALTEARASAESLRGRLARVPTPGDGDDLLEELAGALMAAREALDGVHRARAGIREAEARAEAAAARRERAVAERRAAEKEVERADEERSLLDGWSQRLTEAPLSTLKSDADDLRTGSALADLADDLDDAVPEKLRQGALKRRELTLLRRSNARALAALARDFLDAGSDEPAAEEETAYRRARSALAEYVRGAGETLERARAFLEGEVPETGEGEDDELQELAGDGAPAADLEIAVTEALIEEENRSFDLREAELRALADPSQDPSVVSDAEDALATAVSDREDAVSDYEEAAEDHARNLERWEVALPEEVWRFFHRFQRVSDALDRLATLDPADLESDLDDAEEALAGARFEAAEAERRRRELEVRHGELSTLRQGTEEAFEARMLSAVRGDG